MINDTPETERRRLRRLLDSLPERQSQCACWAFSGMSNKEIGHEIGCATRTVKSHLSKVYARLGLQHNSAFVKRAIMVKTMIDTSKHQEAGAEMSHLFSPHQIDVLNLVSEGLKNKEIARCLSMRENMIKNDLRRIFDLAGCDTRVEVVVWWRNHRGCGEGTVNRKRDSQATDDPCKLQTGAPRYEPHRTRKLSAAEAIQNEDDGEIRSSRTVDLIMDCSELAPNEVEWSL